MPVVTEISPGGVGFSNGPFSLRLLEAATRLRVLSLHVANNVLDADALRSLTALERADLTCPARVLTHLAAPRLRCLTLRLSEYKRDVDEFDSLRELRALRELTLHRSSVPTSWIFFALAALQQGSVTRLALSTSWTSEPWDATALAGVPPSVRELDAGPLEELPREWTRLTALEDLTLHYRSGLSSPTFGTLGSLSSLTSLAFCPLPHAPPELLVFSDAMSSLSAATRLVGFSMLGNGVAVDVLRDVLVRPPLWLSRLASLRDVTLRFCAFEDPEWIGCLRALSRLTYLSLERLGEAATLPLSLSRLSSLDTLNATGVAVVDDDAARSLALAPRLRTIICDSLAPFPDWFAKDFESRGGRFEV